MLSKKEIEVMIEKSERKLNKAIAKKGIYNKNRLFKEELVFVKKQIKKLETEIRIMKLIIKEEEKKAPNMLDVLLDAFIIGAIMEDIMGDQAKKEQKKND